MPRNHPSSIPVLIVDDDPASAKLMAVLLRGEGCDARITRSAEEATLELQTFRPRAIALDLRLPLMSGLAFAQRLKADPVTRDIVIVAVTAINGPSTDALATAAGCAACIRKPIEPLAFIELFADLLGTRK
jgi:CheY-like chemotaxis protein